jgi:chromosome segregation ATPase
LKSPSGSNNGSDYAKSIERERGRKPSDNLHAFNKNSYSPGRAISPDVEEVEAMINQKLKSASDKVKKILVTFKKYSQKHASDEYESRLVLQMIELELKSLDTLLELKGANAPNFTNSNGFAYKSSGSMPKNLKQDGSPGLASDSASVYDLRAQIAILTRDKAKIERKCKDRKGIIKKLHFIFMERERQLNKAYEVIQVLKEAFVDLQETAALDMKSKVDRIKDYEMRLEKLVDFVLKLRESLGFRGELRKYEFQIDDYNFDDLEARKDSSFGSNRVPRSNSKPAGASHINPTDRTKKNSSVSQHRSSPQKRTQDNPIIDQLISEIGDILGLGLQDSSLILQECKRFCQEKKFMSTGLAQSADGRRYFTGGIMTPKGSASINHKEPSERVSQIDKTIEEIKQLKEEKAKEVKKLKSHLAEANLRLHDKEKQHLEEEIALKNKIGELQDQISELQQENIRTLSFRKGTDQKDSVDQDRFINQIKELQAAVTQLTQEKSLLQQSHNRELDNMKDKLNTTTKNANSAKAGLESQIKDLQSQLAAAKAELSQSSKRASKEDESSQEIVKLNREISSLQKVIEKLKAEAAEVASKKSSAESEAMTTSSKLQGIKDKLAETENRLDRALESEKSSAKVIQNLEGEVNTLKSEKDDLRISISVLEGEIAVLKKTNEELQVAIKQHQEAYHELQRAPEVHSYPQETEADYIDEEALGEGGLEAIGLPPMRPHDLYFHGTDQPLTTEIPIGDPIELGQPTVMDPNDPNNIYIIALERIGEELDNTIARKKELDVEIHQIKEFVTEQFKNLSSQFLNSVTSFKKGLLATISSLKESKEKLAKRVVEVEKLLAHEKELVEEVNKKLLCSLGQKEQLEAQTLKKLKFELEESHKQNQTLQSKLNEKESERANFEADLKLKEKQFNSSIQSLKDEVAERDRTIKALENKIETFNVEQKKQEKSLNDKISQLQANEKTLTQELQKAESQKGKAESDLKMTKASLASKEAEITDLKGITSAQNQKLAESPQKTAIIDALKSENKTLSDLVNQLRTNQNELEKQKNKAIADSKSLQNDLSQEQSKVTSLTSQLGSLTRDIQSKVSDIDVLKNEKVQLTKNYQNLENDLQKANGTIAKLEANTKVLDAKIASQTKELLLATSAAQTVKPPAPAANEVEEIKSLKAQLEQREAEYKRKEQDYEQERETLLSKVREMSLKLTQLDAKAIGSKTSSQPVSQTGMHKHTAGEGGAASSVHIHSPSDGTLEEFNQGLEAIDQRGQNDNQDGEGEEEYNPYAERLETVQEGDGFDPQEAFNKEFSYLFLSNLFFKRINQVYKKKLHLLNLKWVRAKSSVGIFRRIQEDNTRLNKEVMEMTKKLMEVETRKSELEDQLILRENQLEEAVCSRTIREDQMDSRMKQNKSIMAESKLSQYFQELVLLLKNYYNFEFPPFDDMNSKEWDYFPKRIKSEIKAQLEKIEDLQDSINQYKMIIETKCVENEALADKIEGRRIGLPRNERLL